MAFALSTFNTSGFRLLRSSVADLSEFIIILTPYLPSSDFSELEIKLTYSSAFEYYFTVTLNGESVPYDFQSDNIRLQMFSSEEYAFFKVEYPVECYVSSCPESLFLEQTLLPFCFSDNGSGDASTPVDSSSRMPSLNGNGSRYRDGSIVKVTTLMDEFKVAWSGLVRTDANIYTIYYDLLRKMPNGEYSERHCVPESLVYLEAEVQPSSGAA